MLSKSANSMQGYPEVPTTPEAEVLHLQFSKFLKATLDRLMEDRRTPRVFMIRP